ncbi:MAG: glycosyltransferase [Gammaproteobacteria bacterium]|nr:glycosyltransferase [Gammaproteobacteria bacterium]
MTDFLSESVDISAIIPVGGRYAPDLLGLYADYKKGLEALGSTYEVIVVLDGPRPQLAADVQRLLSSGERVSVISLTKRFGEATALVAGFQRARGRIILTLPAYHQIRGDDIGRLVRALGVTDLAIGRRWPRAGNRFEAMRRDAFHRMLSSITGQRFHDLGCGARAMKRRVLEEINLYGDQHRFLPVLAGRLGFRVLEVELHQSPLDRYEGGYPPREYIRRVLDICTVFFLVRFTKKPLRFFGMVGVSTFLIGAALVAWLALDKLIFRHPLADRPALLLSSLLVVLGMQLFALGLLGELIIFTHARDIKDYQIEEVVRYPAPAPPPAEQQAAPPLEPVARASHQHIA